MDEILSESDIYYVNIYVITIYISNVSLFLPVSYYSYLHITYNNRLLERYIIVKA